MGIVVEFNPDLCLRKYGTNGRDFMECLPEVLEREWDYPFLKKGQRNYYLEGEILLMETKGDGRLSRPIASVLIMEAKHLLIGGNVWTEGRYKVNEVYDPEDPQIHFEGYARVR